MVVDHNTVSGGLTYPHRLRSRRKSHDLGRHAFALAPLLVDLTKGGSDVLHLCCIEPHSHLWSHQSRR